MRGVRFLLLAAAAAAALLATGCDECAGLAVRLCECTDGTTGTQTCEPRDGRFGSCLCDTTPPLCGDATCDPGEERTCPRDCGPTDVCGDGVCGFTESNATCPFDCPAICGDFVCAAGETPASCPDDCATTICGDGLCDVGETADTCPADCMALCEIRPSGREERIGDAPVREGGPAIALDRGVWWITWIASSPTTMESVTMLAAHDGVAVSAVPIESDSVPQRGAAVAALDGTVAVAWLDAGGDLVFTVRNGLVTEVVPPSPLGPAVHGAALDVDGGAFVLAWATVDGIRVRRFDRSGVPLGPDALVPGAPVTAPSLEPAGGGDVAVAWVDAASPTGDVRLAIVDPAGVVGGSDEPLAQDVFTNAPPGLAWTGPSLIVAWAGPERSGYVITDTAGRPGPRTSTIPGAPGDVFSPQPLNAGPENLIAWVTVGAGGDVAVARLDGTTGDLRRPASATTGRVGLRDPALAWNGTDIAAVWVDDVFGAPFVSFTTFQICF